MTSAIYSRHIISSKSILFKCNYLSHIVSSISIQRVTEEHISKTHFYKYYIPHDNQQRPFCSSIITKKITEVTDKVNHESEKGKLSICIVGAGPAGLYTCKYLNNFINTKTLPLNLEIDIIDHLPTPFGLIRYGIAPDHLSAKNIQNDLSKVFLSKNVRFCGNITVGHHISLKDLRKLYDVVILAYGCSDDYMLKNIKGSELNGILSAREFVGWYNGHPDYVYVGTIVGRIFEKNISNQGKKKKKKMNIVIIGNGNVALDCARILTKGKEALVNTDISNDAIEVLGRKKEHMNVTIVGRRGHVQGSYSIKELREIIQLERNGYGILFHLSKNELDLGMTKSTLQELQKGAGFRSKVRIDALLNNFVTVNNHFHNDDDILLESESKSNETIRNKKITLRFLLQPIVFQSCPYNYTELGSILFKRTLLSGDTGKQVAVCVDDDHTEVISANMCLISIGYKGKSLPGMDAVFCSDRGTLRHTRGRVITNKPGLYVSGWLKRGAVGIIGSNVIDAKETVSSILEDLENGILTIGRENLGLKKKKTGSVGLNDFMLRRNVTVVNWEGYKCIDTEERKISRLRSKEQTREKITNINTMLELLSKQS